MKKVLEAIFLPMLTACLAFALSSCTGFSFARNSNIITYTALGSDGAATVVEVPAKYKGHFITKVGAFSDCQAIKNVSFAGSDSEWCSIYIGAGNTYLTDAKLKFNAAV